MGRAGVKNVVVKHALVEGIGAIRYGVVPNLEVVDFHHMLLRHVCYCHHQARHNEHLRT